MNHYQPTRKFIFNRTYTLILIIFLGFQVSAQKNISDVRELKPDQMIEREMTGKAGSFLSRESAAR